MYVIHANGQFIKVELTNLSLYRASEMIPVSGGGKVKRDQGTQFPDSAKNVNKLLKIID